MSSATSSTYADDSRWPDLQSTPPAMLQFAPHGRISSEGACRKRIAKAVKKYEGKRKEAQDELDKYLEDQKEMQRRLDREQGKEGELTISLKWDNTDYLDLRVIHPGEGGAISYLNTSACGGELDVDTNSEDASLTSEPVKNVVWMKCPPEGAYQIWVDVCNKRETEETPWTCLVTMGSEQPQCFSGKSFAKDQSMLAVCFTYPFDSQVPPQILNTLPSEPELKELREIYRTCIDGFGSGSQCFLLNSYELKPLLRMIKQAHLGLVKRALLTKNKDALETALANAKAEDYHCRPIQELKKLGKA